MTSAFEQFNLTQHYVSAAVYHQILCCRVFVSFNFLKGTKFCFYWSFPHFAFCNTVVEIDFLACWHIECRCRYENVNWTGEITAAICGWKKVWHSLFNFKMILDVVDETFWFSWCPFLAVQIIYLGKENEIESSQTNDFTILVCWVQLISCKCHLVCRYTLFFLCTWHWLVSYWMVHSR